MKSGAVFFGVAILLLTAVFYLAKPSRSHWKAPAGMIGELAPDFALKDLNGNDVQLSSLRGKAVVLNFWATWCGPCWEETPWFVDLQKQYGPQGLQIIGVALDNSSLGVIKDTAKEMHINYPVMLGNDSVANSYGGVQSLPTTIYIARSGKIIDSVIGVIDKEQIENKIHQVLTR